MELIMPLVHRLLQIATEQTTKLSRAIILGTLLLAALNSSWAQDPGVVTTGKPNPLYPDDAEITFQWNYVCPANRPCTFVCRGAGGGGGSDNSVGYLFGNVTSQRRSAGTGGSHFL
jgi:hypothetical protein